MCIGPFAAKTPPIPVAPRPEDPLAASNRQRQQRANAQGYQSTILTSGLGVTQPANTQPKTILGG